MSMPSSPASSRGTSPAPMLTPRSKIKALLATVESSDEEGGNSNSGGSAQKSTIGRSIGTAALVASDSNSDEPDVDIRPRGKLASRMQGGTTTSSPPKAAEPHQPEDARERVRKMFEREQELKEAEAREATAVPPAQEEQAGEQRDDEDEDDDLPVVPRRFKRRSLRESTPENDESTTRPSSPGLFVSPAAPSPSKSVEASGLSDSDEDDLPSIKSDRFKALVERKRQERLAREAAEEAEREERRARQEKLSSEMDQLDSADDNVSDITDDEGGRKLTQDGARPSRKASRKAVEEMTRETQRMARSMQLAHEAKTRKKISKNSLFEKFNFRPEGEPPVEMQPQPQSSSRPTTPQSDADVQMGDAETPPTSPPSATKMPGSRPVPVQEMAGGDEKDLPTLDAVLTSPSVPNVDKGKEKAINVLPEQPVDNKPKRRVRVKLPPLSKTLAMADSDDELQITATTKDKVNAVFDSVPLNKAKESHSLQVFRALALVQSPDTSRGRRKVELAKMTPNELLSSLQQKARAQAKVERDRRLELLKSQGIVVQSIEERERQMEEVDKIVAKAREEAQRLMEQERDEVKKDRKGDSAADPLAWDDSDDEYQASDKELDEEEASAIELSGSEDEEVDEADDADDESDAANPIFDDEADESENDEAEKADKDEDMAENDDGDDEEPRVKRRRARTNMAVLSDDEDGDAIAATPKPLKSGNIVSPPQPNTESPAAPSSVLRSAKKTFIPGLPVQGPAGLGLTQIFAGTMDDSQMSPVNNSGPTQPMLPDFDHFPDSNFSATADHSMDDIVESTQMEDTQKPTQGIRLNMSQSQMHGLDSLLRDGYDAHESQTIELSQDGGFQTYTPIRDRFVEPPYSTVDTVAAGHEQNDEHASPLVRRGRLRRKAEFDSAVQQTQPAPTEVTQPASAFNVMKERTKQKEKRSFTDAFDRKKSKAKEMVEQEAEESDDEYAGLGGADGEDSDNESIASMKEMIDDEGPNDVDESKLAAFYADRTRKEDEEGVEKLFKDITTGMLRRKRGSGYDLSDDDDDGEARKRMKRRQFAKMQQALFSDERVKKMAENPGNQAFLRTIEDRGSDDEMDILEVMDVPSQAESETPPQSQDASTAAQTIPDSQPRKALGSAGENRAPANQRRTKTGKKPSNIGEVRETLSNLLEEPEASLIPATDAGSDSEDEQYNLTRSDKENRSPNSNNRRSRGVVDRISIKRTNSNNSTGSSSSKLAFAAQTTGGSNAFRVPSLLRRATTNSSMLSTSTTSGGTAGSAGGFGEETKIKKIAGKGSGVMSRAVPENEGRARLQENERRREEKKMKGAERRIGVVGGLLGRGSFE